jgi:hypothetical protein
VAPREPYFVAEVPRESARSEIARALAGAHAEMAEADAADADVTDDALRPAPETGAREQRDGAVSRREAGTVEPPMPPKQSALVAERSEIDLSSLRALRPDVRWMRTVGVEREGAASVETTPAEPDAPVGREPVAQRGDERRAGAELRRQVDAGWSVRFEQPEALRERWSSETRLADLGRDNVQAKPSRARAEVEPLRAGEPAALSPATLTAAERFAPTRSTVGASAAADATPSAGVVRAAAPSSGSGTGSGAGAGLGAGTTPLPIDPAASLDGVARLAHANLADAIVARARALAPGGSIGLNFALEPEELGMVRIHIEARGDDLRVRIVAASGAAVEALSGGISRLSSQLHDAGFKDARIDLTFEDSTGRGPRERDEGGWRQDDDAQRTRPQVPAVVVDARRTSAHGATTRLDRMA